MGLSTEFVQGQFVQGVLALYIDDVFGAESIHHSKIDSHRVGANLGFNGVTLALYLEDDVWFLEYQCSSTESYAIMLREDWGDVESYMNSYDTPSISTHIIGQAVYYLEDMHGIEVG